MVVKVKMKMKMVYVTNYKCVTDMGTADIIYTNTEHRKSRGREGGREGAQLVLAFSEVNTAWLLKR